MTDILDIISDNWDTDIIAEPAIIDDSKDIRRGYLTVISTRRTTTIDDIEGVIARQFFNPDAYDAWVCWAISPTEANTELLIKAIKKVCATFIPTSAENILQWQGGEWKPFNGTRYEFRFILIKRKSGIQAY